MLMAGIVVVLDWHGGEYFPATACIAPSAISAVFILISSGAILYETSNIIHGETANYIQKRPPVRTFLLYNIFVSLLSIFSFASRD